MPRSQLYKYKIKTDRGSEHFVIAKSFGEARLVFEVATGILAERDIDPADDKILSIEFWQMLDSRDEAACQEYLGPVNKDERGYDE